MSEIVYAVHTRACTYLLDEDGFCKWVLSRSGARSDDRCVGAQFVAALDLRSKGGLIGELRIGAQALFIRQDEGRFALIRTKPIEHVEIRGAEGSGVDSDQADTLPEEPDPVVLPDHLAVAAVFNAPPPVPEPLPPSARVILQTPSHSHQAYGTVPISAPAPTHPGAYPAYGGAAPMSAPAPMLAPMEESSLPPLPAPPPPRKFPEPPPRVVPPSRPPASANVPLARVPEPLVPSYAEPAASEPPPPARKFPEPPPRARPSQPRNDPSQETQPLPSLGPLPPTGPVAAWPPVMMAPPPPQAEMVALGPPRAPLASSEELDVDDLEEVGDDDQIYSMEVTLTLPLFRGEALPPPARRPIDPRQSKR